LYNYKLSNSEVSSAYVKYNGKDMTVYSDEEFRYAYNAFEAGTQKNEYVASFPLKSQVSNPRMCSLKSA